VPGKRFVSVLVGLVAAAALAGVAGAAAVQSDVSSNWGGYVASSPIDTATGLPSTFSAASGTWVEPTATCGTGVATSGPTSSAFWVGLGGNSGSSQALEQLGTEADCTAAGKATYFAWYELVPGPSHRIKMTVDPGDKITASVNVTGTKVTLSLKDVTTGTGFSHVFTKQTLDTGSAEWIAEAPSLCDGNDCRETALTDFGKVAFSQASATVDGHTGTIKDSDWTTTVLRLVTGGGGRFGDFSSESTASKATPTGLTSGATGFTVKWSVSQSPAGDGYPGGGYVGYPGGGGYGGGGYGGGGYGGGGYGY
jgi:Peptidase A4 family